MHEALLEVLATRGLQADPIVVLGMHRSGTTLVAQILERAGVYMGARLSPNHEPRLFQDANRQILDYFGASWSALATMPGPEVLRDAYSGLRHDVARRLSEDMAWSFLPAALHDGRVWGWKDPRNSLTAPLFVHLFPKARALFIYRHAAAVGASLAARDARLASKGGMSGGGFGALGDDPQASALALWETYNLRALACLRHFETHVALAYEDLLDDPRAVLARVLDRLGVTSRVPLEHLCEAVRRPERGNASIAESTRDARYEAARQLYERMRKEAAA